MGEQEARNNRKKTPALALESAIRVHLPFLYYKLGDRYPEIPEKRINLDAFTSSNYSSNYSSDLRGGHQNTTIGLNGNRGDRIKLGTITHIQTLCIEPQQALTVTREA